jgi:hypothetical protein
MGQKSTVVGLAKYWKQFLHVEQNAAPWWPRPKRTMSAMLTMHHSCTAIFFVFCIYAEIFIDMLFTIYLQEMN